MLKQFANITINQTRNYAFKSHLKIKWIRPAKLQCYDPKKSGDLEPKKEISPDRPTFEFRKSQELLDASEEVKKLCSVGFHSKQSANYLVRRELQSQVKRHKYDSNSMEVRIAIMTGRIRCLQEHLANNPKESKAKVACKELIDRRKKFLKYLRRWDHKRFEWILEKLSLEYKSPASVIYWVTRRRSLVKLTDLHCEEVKAKKMAEYKEYLIKEWHRLLDEFGIDPKDRPPYAPDPKREELEIRFRDAYNYLKYMQTEEKPEKITFT